MITWNYISGFFDADGSVTCIRPRKGKNKTLQISFSNVEVSILKSIQEFIHKELGIRGSLTSKKIYKDHHQVSYELKYVYTSALRVANKIDSFHPKKKYRIKVYNEIQKVTSRNGKYSDEQLIQREKLIEKFFRE